MKKDLLARIDEVPKEYMKWVCDCEDGEKAIAAIPARNASDKQSRTYFSIRSLANKEGDWEIRVVPVFLVKNQAEEKREGSSLFPSGSFLFDSEYDMMWTPRKKGKKIIDWDKQVTYDDMGEDIIRNPYILFFKGPNEWSVGMRFSTEEKAMNYLYRLEVFEDVFKSPALQYHG